MRCWTLPARISRRVARAGELDLPHHAVGNVENDVGAALLEYAQGTRECSAVETAFVDGWAREYEAAKK